MLGYDIKVDTSLYSDDDYYKFLIFLKKEGKIKKKRLNYTNSNWDKKTRIRKAKDERDKLKDTPVDVNLEIKLDEYSERQFKLLPNTSWTRTKISHYNRYIKPYIGNKKLVDIKATHIKEVNQKQETIHNLAPRTVKQTLEILKPIFDTAIEDGIRLNNPTSTITIKRPKTKKLVTNPDKYIVDVFNAINSVFNKDPFYKSLFLFYLQGRRKSEPLNLKWKHIDFENNSYTCVDVKNGETQTFFLPKNIKELLLEFGPSECDSFIYEGKIEGQPLKDFRKQINKISNIVEGFTLHYLRNVIVTMMGKEGISDVHMSGALGHNNTNTLKEYLSMPYATGSKIASDVIDAVIKNKD